MANRYQNDYNDQDYPHYYDRNDRYDSQSERRGSDRSRGEQRNRYGSGRENTQGGSYDYNQFKENFGFSGADSNRDTAGEQQGFGGSGFQSGYFGNDYGRGYDSGSHLNDDFASTYRAGDNRRNLSREERHDNRGDYTLYGYDRDRKYADRSGDYGNQGERTRDYSNNYNYSGASYARSDDDRQPIDGRGGSSRYRGEQRNQSDYERQQNSGQSFYGQGGGDTGNREKGFDNRRSTGGAANRYRPRNEQEERGWWERTTDEVASWFGDDEAARRRENDSHEENYGQHQNRGQYGQQTSSHRGRGPKNYRRSDDRIKEDINDRLTDYAYLDASDIDAEVNGGEVTLTGTVESRYAKRMAEDIAENVSGVTHLENRLRVKNQNQSNEYSAQNQAGFSATNAVDSSGTYGSPEDLAANYSNQGLSETSPLNKPATGNLTGSSKTSDSDSGTMAVSASGSGTSASEITVSNDKIDSSSTILGSGSDKYSGSSK